MSKRSASTERSEDGKAMAEREGFETSVTFTYIPVDEKFMKLIIWILRQ